MDCFAQTFLLIFCYICYDIFIFYFHKAIIVLCANISQVQPFQTTELSGFGTLSDKKSLQPQLTTEGREYWAEHHCIVGFVRSNFLSGLCMAWPTISYVCPLLFHRLFVCIPHSLAHFWIPRNWLSTVHMPLHLLDFDVSGWLFGQRFFSPKNGSVFRTSSSDFGTWICFQNNGFFWKICIRFWKNGLDFGRTDLFLEETYQILEELIRIWMNGSNFGWIDQSFEETYQILEEQVRKKQRNC